jgi:hypothetical protein
MSKHLEGRGRGGSITGMIFLITPVAQSSGDLDGEVRAHQLNERISPSVFEEPSKDPIFPLSRIGQIAMGDENPLLF